LQEEGRNLLQSGGPKPSQNTSQLKPLIYSPILARECKANALALDNHGERQIHTDRFALFSHHIRKLFHDIIDVNHIPFKFLHYFLSISQYFYVGLHLTQNLKAKQEYRK